MQHATTSPRSQELLDALGAFDATLEGVRRAAGQGSTPERERALQAHLRSLRALLGGDATPVVEDAVDAAMRVLDAADPAAPLHVLGMAQQSLTGVLRRQAAAAALPTAA